MTFQFHHDIVRNPASSLVLGVSGDNATPAALVIGQSSQDGHEGQHWFVDPVTNTIRSALQYDYCLDINEGGHLVINPYDKKKTSQNWIPTGSETEKGLIQSIDKQKVLQLDGPDSDEAVIEAQLSNNDPSQIWKFIPAKGATL